MTFESLFIFLIQFDSINILIKNYVLLRQVDYIYTANQSFI